MSHLWDDIPTGILDHFVHITHILIWNQKKYKHRWKFNVLHKNQKEKPNIFIT